MCVWAAARAVDSVVRRERRGGGSRGAARVAAAFAMRLKSRASAGLENKTRRGRYCGQTVKAVVPCPLRRAPPARPGGRRGSSSSALIAPVCPRWLWVSARRQKWRQDRPPDRSTSPQLDPIPTASSLRPRGRTTNKTRKSYKRRSRGLEMLQAWAALQAGGESIIWHATVFAAPVVVTKR